MKKKFLKAICILTAVMMCSLTACTNVQTETTAISFNDIIVSDEGLTGTSVSDKADITDNSDTQDTGSESGNTQADVPDMTDSSKINTLGGYPWLDTDIKANLSEDIPADPADNFHWYVNKDWLLSTDIPEGYGGYSTFHEVQRKTDANGLAVLEDDSLTGHEAELIQDLYHSILDWDSRDALGLAPAETFIQTVNDIKSLDDLNVFLYNEDNTLLSGWPFELDTAYSLDDPSVYTSAIKDGSWVLEDAAEYTNRTRLGELNYNGKLMLAKDMLTRLGYSEEDAQKMFENAVSLEEKLSIGALTKADEMDTNYFVKVNNSFSPDELQKLFSNFPIADYIAAKEYDKSNNFLVMDPALIKNFDEVYTEENLEFFKDYLIVKYVIDNAAIFDSKAYDSYVHSQNIIKGTSGKIDEKEQAFKVVRSTLREPMGQAYLSVYDASETKERITEICEEVIAEYRNMLSEEDWLSDATREKAIEKLDHMTINSVYPDKWTDYSSMDLSGLNYYESMVVIRKFNDEQKRKNINSKVDHDYWDMSEMDILEANAFYNPYDNSINIILGILNDPIYYDGMTDEALFGGIGAAIGHEISHAFDPVGAQFDKDGRFINWWSEEDNTAFKKRAEKQIAYYDSMRIWDGAPVNGSNIQGEVVADMAGMKVLMRLAKKNENFDYDSFFRSYANIWKLLVTPERELYSLTQDPHPVQYLRTNVTVQQFDEFYETYGVKEGDNMYLAPEDRVLVW